ncbi:Hypothetical predicted protein [Mytilus galloprovincialis]|uniref:Uncharacterized protein n=1 Tax=Mytilus galloprovincialis TaxID=29158 RepID=A0A8B6FHE5_MYTGA|nr:Hypothetical predicted protein [Mytilus galloprovincialis]
MLFSTYTLTGRVLVFDSNGKRLFDDLTKTDRPCLDITGMGDNYKVAITCGFVNGIEIVDISKSKLKLQKRIPTKNGCFGVAFNDDSLFCCIHREGIQKINLDNYSLSPIVKFDLTFGYITVHNNKLYNTDRDKNTVTCYDMQGQLLLTCQDDTYLKAPCNISVDNNEFVYVVSEEMNSITVLSPDGQDKRMLLTNSDGLKLPRALHFDKLRNRLLVAFEEASTFLFDVSV